MRGEYKGKWYADIFESTRFKGTTMIEVHEFNTEDEQQAFVNDYNQVLLTHINTPETYRMAQTSSLCTIYDYLNRKENKQ